jgi:hypothetical protein
MKNAGKYTIVFMLFCLPAGKARETIMMACRHKEAGK